MLHASRTCTFVICPIIYLLIIQLAPGTDAQVAQKRFFSTCDASLVERLRRNMMNMNIKKLPWLLVKKVAQSHMNWLPCTLAQSHVDRLPCALAQSHMDWLPCALTQESLEMIARRS